MQDGSDEDSSEGSSESGSVSDDDEEDDHTKDESTIGRMKSEERRSRYIKSRMESQKQSQML